MIDMNLSEIDPLFKTTEVKPMVVGFLDLLGTSRNIVYRGIGPALKTFENRYHAVECAKLFYGASGIHRSQNVRTIFFSDSVLFLSEIMPEIDREIAILTTTAVIAGSMMNLLLLSGIASRGAIACGDICLDDECNFLFGIPLVQVGVIERLLNAACLAMFIPWKYRYVTKSLIRFGWLSSAPVPLKEGANKRLNAYRINTSRLHLVRYFNEEGEQERKNLFGCLRVLSRCSQRKRGRPRTLLVNAQKFLRSELRTLKTREEKC